MSQNFRSLLVEGKVSDLPDAIEVDITNVRIGHKIRVSEMNITGLRFLDPADAVVLGVAMSRGASEEEEEKKKKKEKKVLKEKRVLKEKKQKQQNKIINYEISNRWIG